MNNLITVHKNWGNTYDKNRKKILNNFYYNYNLNYNPYYNNFNHNSNFYPYYTLQTSIPKKFDWRDVRQINPPGDQLQTGLCYLFASLYSFSDRYTIVNNLNPYIRFSIVEAAAILKISGINDDPMNNGDPSQFSQMLVNPIYYTVKEGNNTFNNLNSFCKSITSGDAKDCKCQRNCDDDDWQTQISERLPNNLNMYNNMEKYPNREDYDISVNNMDDAIDFGVLSSNVFNGPIPYVFFFNGDLWRDNTDGKAWKQTGNIYTCIHWDDTSNPFGYTANGFSDVGGGHVISIIGYGTDNIDMNYKGRKYNVDVNYVWCRNSWGKDSDKAYFKAAWKQRLNLGETIEIMSDVWRGTSIIDLIPKKVSMYDCVSGSCIENNNGKYTLGECQSNCKKVDMYNCIEGECIKSKDGKYTLEECSSICEKIKPKNNMLLISSLIVFSLVGIITIILMILYIKQIK